MTKKREKSDLSADFSAQVSDDLKRFVAAAAGPRTWTDSIESMLWRASQRLGITHRRAKAFWYREAGGIGADEYLMVRERAQELLERQAAHVALQVEIAELDRQERASSKRVGAKKDPRPDGDVEQAP